MDLKTQFILKIYFRAFLSPKNFFEISVHIKIMFWSILLLTGLCATSSYFAENTVHMGLKIATYTIAVISFTVRVFLVHRIEAWETNVCVLSNMEHLL